MPSFNNLTELESYLKEQIADSLEKDVAEKSKKLMRDHVKNDVYKVYDPSKYERREDYGGLSDVENMQHEVGDKGNEVDLTIANLTMSNPKYLPDNKHPFYISGVVEYGDEEGYLLGYGKYDYVFNKDDRYLKPRSFISNTRYDLQNGKAKEYIKEALQKRLGKDSVE